MAFWYNRWTLSGRVVKDPGQPRYLPSGQPQLDFMIANSRPSAGKGTTQSEQVSFFEIVTRGRQAEACAEHLRKGSPVFIEGEAMQMAYPASGNAPIRKRVVLRARMVWFLAPGINMTAAEDPSGVEIPE
jgi:single-strand DNA-binding protein